ncbi:MAG TPA: FliH/SctL family protein, partial [Rhizobacter sp.]|nr:FliH/SctL family protein [Rhizobacter sp.]
GYETGLAAGHAAGLQAGRDEALQQARGELERLAAPLDALRRELDGLHADWQASLRRDVVELVERVARQVVRCELALKPAQVLALVEETLAAMPAASGAITVYLNPSDLHRIAELDAQRPEAWSLVADSSLEPGGCRVKVGDTEVDAGCQQRLAACVDQIRQQLVPEAQA